MISNEAYRSAIGRFYGKMKKTDKPKTSLPSELTSSLFQMVVLLVLYGLMIAFSCTECFVYFIMLFILFMAYGYCLTIFGITMDLVAVSFQKMTIREKMFRKPSLPNGIKAHQPLIHWRYLDTFVLDGRDGKPGIEMILNIDMKNTKIYHSAHTVYGFSRKLFSKLINPGYRVVLIALISLSLSFMYDFIKTNNTSRQFGNLKIHPNHTRNYLELYSVHHIKLILLLVDGDIESNPGPVDNNRETPKGRGRPKKVKKVFPKRKLDFTNADTIMPVNFADQVNVTNKISVLKSDILDMKCEVIVNAANIVYWVELELMELFIKVQEMDLKTLVENYLSKEKIEMVMIFVVILVNVK